MESNRSSPLSTLIMMMPLVVVPALAILRPAEQDNGFANDDLAAAQGVDFFEFEPSSGSGDSFSRLLDSAPAPSRLQSSINQLDAPLHDDWLGPSLLDDRSIPSTAAGRRHEPAMPAAGSQQNSEVQLLLTDLKRFGVTRFVWFQPGRSSEVGFVAFVPSESGDVSYRFEAIAASQSDAVRGVIRDVREWHTQRTGSSNP